MCGRHGEGCNSVTTRKQPGTRPCTQSCCNNNLYPVPRMLPARDYLHSIGHVTILTLLRDHLYSKATFFFGPSVVGFTIITCATTLDPGCSNPAQQPWTQVAATLHSNPGPRFQQPCTATLDPGFSNPAQQPWTQVAATLHSNPGPRLQQPDNNHLYSLE